MIYFLRASGTDLVKIGYTRDHASLQVRIQTLQTGQPHALELLRVIENADLLAEKMFHRLFAKNHYRGEWFTYTPAMMDFSLENKYGLRRCVQTPTRAVLEELIEHLVGLLDQWTENSDFEAEPDAEPDTDSEPDAEGYVFIPRTGRDQLGLPFDAYPSEDAEPSLVEIEAC